VDIFGSKKIYGAQITQRLKQVFYLSTMGGEFKK
jgi:hypothetical protein